MLNSDRDVVDSHLDLEEHIRRRAHELWEARTREGGEGSALDDWLAAERQVLGQSRQPAQDRGTTVGSARRPDRRDVDRLTRE